MNRLTITISLIFIPLLVSAQGVSKAFLNMPDDLIPYLKQADRELFLHEYSEGNDSTVVTKPNNLSGNSTLYQIVEDKALLADSTVTSCDGYLHFAPSDNYDLQIIQEYPDTCIYVIETYSAPASESKIVKYDSHWNRLGQYVPPFSVGDMIKDDVTDDMRQKAVSYIELNMFNMTYDFHAKEVKVSVSMPNLSNEEKKEIETCFLQRNVKIRNVSFNER